MAKVTGMEGAVDEEREALPTTETKFRLGKGAV